MAEQTTEPLTCLDAPPEAPGWTCIQYDGTGLWCAHCRARAALSERSKP